ncbi:MAG: M67 family metallopeptidase [Thermodesulfovibrionales bacterium]
MMQATAGSETKEKLIIPSTIYEEMISHCRDGYPNEACGILSGKDGVVKNIYRMKNIENSPVSYMMDPSEQFKVMKDMRSEGLSMLAIFHSHPCAAAYPSAKDVSLAFYDDVVYIIVSLVENAPVVKGYSIKGGRVEEVEIITEGI